MDDKIAHTWKLKSAGYQHAKLLHESEHTLEKVRISYSDI